MARAYVLVNDLRHGVDGETTVYPAGTKVNTLSPSLQRHVKENNVYIPEDTFLAKQAASSTEPEEDWEPSQEADPEPEDEEGDSEESPDEEDEDGESEE